MTSDRTQRVIAQLEEVLDPCSCMTENPVNIVDLGLVEEIKVEDSSVRVELVPTTPMCLYMAQIIDEAEAELLKIDDIEEVKFTQNIEKLWRPDRMDDELLQRKENQYNATFQDISTTT